MSDDSIGLLPYFLIVGFMASFIFWFAWTIYKGLEEHKELDDRVRATHLETHLRLLNLFTESSTVCCGGEPVAVLKAPGVCCS